MGPDEMSEEENLVLESTQTQLRYFQQADPRCRGLQLPEGILLRYTLAQALYFYLRTGVAEGKIRTRVYASDSPYDRMNSDIGEVATPMFESHADAKHLRKLERLLREWVEFVKDEPDLDEPFTSFPIDDQPQ
jgi:hypothetical protein